MNATVKPRASTTATPSAAEGAKAARSTVGGEGAASADRTKAKADSKPASDKKSGDTADKKEPSWWDRISEFFSSFTEEGGIGKIIGGLLGLGGAYFAGNLAGGGIMSTILMVALAIPFMLVGSESIGGWINGLFKKSDGKSSGDSPERSQSRGVAPARTREELTTKMETIRDELEAYNRVAERHVRAGKLNGVTIESLLKAQAISRKTLDEVASGIPQANDATEIARIDGILDGLNRGLEDRAKRNTEITAEVKKEFDAIRSGRTSGSSGVTTPQPTGVAKALTNKELQALLDEPDNLKDRITPYFDNTNTVQVRAVADSEPDRRSIITYEKLRRDILSKVDNPTGIAVTPLSDGNIRIVATTLGSVPGANTGQGRQ